MMALFRRKPFVIHARRVRPGEEEMVQVFGTKFVAKAGDWIMGVETERQTVCQDKVFRELYDPVDDESKKEMDGDVSPGSQG
jgi:hypothetical protein